MGRQKGKNGHIITPAIQCSLWHHFSPKHCDRKSWKKKGNWTVINVLVGNLDKYPYLLEFQPALWDAITSQFLAYPLFSQGFNSLFHFLHFFFFSANFFISSFCSNFLWGSDSQAQLFLIISIYIYYQIFVLTCSHSKKVMIGWVKLFICSAKIQLLHCCDKLLIFHSDRSSTYKQNYFLEETKNWVYCHLCII